MRYSFYSAVIFITIFLFTGCEAPVYIQQTDTPKDLNGFAGFRWATPMSILDDHLMETMDVVPFKRYNDFYNLAYSNFYFMDKKSYLCKYTFNNEGLVSIKIIFLPLYENVYSDLDYMLGRITEVYGPPVQMTRPAYKPEYLGYIEGYYWSGGRLNLTLMPGDVIIVRAFKYNQGPPDDPPPINPHHREFYEGNAPPVFVQESRIR